MTDVDRSALAAAERAAFDGTDLESLRPFDALQSLITRIVDGPWWPCGPVVVQRARADARSSNARCDVRVGGAPGPAAVARVRLAASQLTVATAAHELAHVLAGIEHGHDAVYRRAYLDIVAVMTNLDTTDRRHHLHVAQLDRAFAATDLAVADRRWPPPPTSTGTPFAL